MTDYLFLAGLVAAFVGVALVSVPLALVVGGLTTSAIAWKSHQPATPPKKTARDPERDD